MKGRMGLTEATGRERRGRRKEFGGEERASRAVGGDVDVC